MKERLHIPVLIIILFLCCSHPVAAWSNDSYSDDLTNPSYSIADLNQFNDEETLRVGAFNIQVFGQTKASKPDVMDVLGKIIRTYDVVAIQEIRDKSQTALPALVDVVNSDNPQYDYVMSERLGRTTSKEQYAYIYNNQTVE
ncbi:MAG: endonuclease/exonuclease/phosphatase family protein, partial [Candidatus Syntropharchaeales archaeon]